MKEEAAWKKLVAASAPTFEGDLQPPFGFSTRTLAAVREAQNERALCERIGIRAIFLSLLAVGAAVVLTVSLGTGDRDDLDPGVQSLALVENVQVS